MHLRFCFSIVIWEVGIGGAESVLNCRDSATMSQTGGIGYIGILVVSAVRFIVLGVSITVTFIATSLRSSSCLFFLVWISPWESIFGGG